MKKLFLTVVAATLALAALTGAAGAQNVSAREHLFVGFSKAPGVAERALVARHGGTVRFSFPEVAALAIDLDSAKVGDLARASGVRYVEQDPVRTPLGLADAELTPSLSNGLYGLITTHAVNAQNSGYTGVGAKACVTDTALDITHPDIAGNFVGGHDSFGGGNTVDASTLGVSETELHATHVSGTLLGVKNSVGVFGVAYGAKLYEARVLGTQSDGSVSGSTSQIMDGARWLANQGCHVINMSLGGGLKSRTEEALYNELAGAPTNTLIVAASGNGGRTRISYPAAYPVVLSVGAVDRDSVHASFSNTGTGLDISAPGVGVLSSVPAGQGRDASVSVGGTTYAAAGMEFSPTTNGVTGTLVNCGYGTKAADCGASPPTGFVALIKRGSPSGKSVTFATKVASAQAAGAAAAIIYNNVAGAFGGTLTTEDNNGTPWIPAVSVSDTDGATLLTKLGQATTVVNRPTSWDTWEGTSMATPHVTGVAALLLGKNATLTPSQLTSKLTSTAHDLGVTGYDTTYGYGLVDATAALAATP